MKTYLMITALLFYLLLPAPVRGQDDISPSDSVSGRPETPDYTTREKRPPITYATPEPEPSNRPPIIQPDYNDFENLYYQKEMWRQYQHEYNRPHRPGQRPQPRGEGRGTSGWPDDN